MFHKNDSVKKSFIVQYAHTHTHKLFFPGSQNHLVQKSTLVVLIMIHFTGIFFFCSDSFIESMVEEIPPFHVKTKRFEKPEIAI